MVQMLADAAEPLKDVVSQVAGGRQVGASGSLLLLGPPGVGTYSHVVERACSDKKPHLLSVIQALTLLQQLQLHLVAIVTHMHLAAAKGVILAIVCAGQVIVVDEVGNAKEVAALRDIAERGVAVVATAHGTTLQQLLDNPTLNGLVGGKKQMVIGDFMAG